MAEALNTHWVLLTGGIGSGKTVVSNSFAELKVPVIDTDIIARELTAQKEGLVTFEIQACFGQQALDQDGLLKRNWMRDKIFRDNRARCWLEFILHPKIFSRVLQLRKDIFAPYGMIVVPVFSSKSIYNAITERILFIDTEEKLQIRRVQQRSHLSVTEIHRIMQAQLPRSKGLKLADDVIVNIDDLKALKAAVLAQHQKYLALFS